MGYWVDECVKKRVGLLGLPRVIGAHSGENLAGYIKKTVQNYEIDHNLGYFMTDNAESNDTCLKALAKWYHFDIKQRRLRCIGHILNLVVQALLFGTNINEFESELRGASEDCAFNIWNKRGAIGKLHNMMTYIRRTDQRRQALRDLQKELTEDDTIFTYNPVVDGKTRWNSVYMMISRGKCRS